MSFQKYLYAQVIILLEWVREACRTGDRIYVLQLHLLTGAFQLIFQIQTHVVFGAKTLLKPMRKTYEPQQRNYMPMTSARILFGVILLFLLILLSFGNFGRC